MGEKSKKYQEALKTLVKTKGVTKDQITLSEEIKQEIIADIMQGDL